MIYIDGLKYGKNTEYSYRSVHEAILLWVVVGLLIYMLCVL